MADVEVSVGANITPFKQAMAQVQATAQQTGEKLGIEGLKGERALHTQITGFFRDISQGANVGEAAINRLGESFKLGAASLVALAAVQYLGTALQQGYEKSVQFAGAFKDAMSIKGGDSQKSIEQLDEEIAQLKENVKSLNLGEADKTSNLVKGSEVLVQGFIDRLSFQDELTKQEEEYGAALSKLHQEEDAAADRTIAQQNEILQLKIDGNEEAASQLKDSLDDQNKLNELQRQGDTQAIADLQTQIELKSQLREVQEEDKAQKERTRLVTEAQAKITEKAASANAEADKVEQKNAFDSLTDAQKILAYKNNIVRNQRLVNSPNVGPDVRAKARLTIDQDNGALEEISKKIGAAFDAAMKKRDELVAQRDQKQIELGEKQNQANEALNDASIFHGQVSSLRKIGLGGSAVQNNSEQVKKLGDIQRELQKSTTELQTLNQKLEST